MPDLFVACLDRDIGSKLFENMGDGIYTDRSDQVEAIGALRRNFCGY